VQLALVDDPKNKLKEKIHHLFLFGTPSGGLFKAFLVSLLKRTAKDMSSKGKFIQDLRKRWDAKYSKLQGKTTPFIFKSIAGDQDEFVSAKSSIKPFPEEAYPGAVAVVPGNHVEIVKPSNAEALSVKIVLETLTKFGKAKGTGPWNAARVAVELGQFRRAVELFEGHEDELDKAALVQYALALEELG